MLLLGSMPKVTKCVRCRKRVATPISAYCGVCEEIIEDLENADMEKNIKECRRCRGVHNSCYIRNKCKTSEVYLTHPNSQHDTRIFHLPDFIKINKKAGLCQFCLQLKKDSN